MPAAQRKSSRYTRIWAALKAVGLTSEDLHDIVFRDYKVDSLTKLTDKQVDSLGNSLWDIANGRSSAPKPATQNKRTDEGGNAATIKQRQKIYMIAKAMGWSVQDIDAFSKKQYGVDSHKWLSPQKCSDMIQALDSMKERKCKETAVQ